MTDQANSLSYSHPMMFRPARPGSRTGVLWDKPVSCSRLHSLGPAEYMCTLYSVQVLENIYIDLGATLEKLINK